MSWGPDTAGKRRGVARFSLTTTSGAESAWREAPPDPLDDPDLYDGLLWRRSLAYLLDVVALALLMAVAWLLLSIAGILTFGLLTPLGAAILALLPAAYHTYFIGSGGATPGMRFFDVELRSWTGQPPDYFQAFLQTALFYTTVLLTSWLILVVCLFNDRRRALHDYLAGTIGVRHSRVQVSLYQPA